eukprot:gene9711-11415_t
MASLSTSTPSQSNKMASKFMGSIIRATVFAHKAAAFVLTHRLAPHPKTRHKFDLGGVSACHPVLLDLQTQPPAFCFKCQLGWPLAEGNLFVLTDWSYRSKVNFFLYEAKEFTGKPLTEGGVRVGYNWAGGKYEVAAFGRNITDTQRITGAIDFNNLTGFINEPRQWGVQFKGSF